MVWYGPLALSKKGRHFRVQAVEEKQVFTLTVNHRVLVKNLPGGRAWEEVRQTAGGGAHSRAFVSRLPHT